MLIYIFAVLVLPVLSVHNILHFGAIHGKDTLQVQEINQKAFQLAMTQANSSDDRTIVVPKNTFYILPVKFINVKDIVLIISGKIVASKTVKNWPVDNGKYQDLIKFQKSNNITIRGGGKVDGRGHHWWILELSTTLKHGRPHLIDFDDTNYIFVHDLIVKNSPNFHIRFDTCKQIEIYNVNIRVNTTAQFNLLKYFTLEGAVPMFPFNTDGIDLWASNAHIYNVTAQCWDDVIVPKPDPINRQGCSENFLVQNITVRLGVGMSIGSVPPHDGTNCVRNVTFRNVFMDHPFKGIYIKTNPGDDGDGIVQNIWYQNITMIKPIWWAIYIGPQQMKQPSGAGPGCMLYPFDPKGTCQTNPHVTLRNIYLTNVSITDSLLYPVTIRCNVSNPCKNFEFKNVNTNKWRIGQKKTGVVCEYTEGKQSNSKPSIYCLKDETQSNNLIKQGFTLNQEKLSLAEIRLLWSRLEEAVRIVPYQQEDDEMEPFEQYNGYTE